MYPETLAFGELAAVYLAIFFAALVHGTLGIGFPMVATPLLALMMDVRSAILLTLFPTVALNLISIAHDGGWRKSLGRFWPLALWALLGGIAGSLLLVSIDSDIFKLLLAVVILLYLYLKRYGGFTIGWHGKYPAVSMCVFGLSAGLSAGTVNVMVPFLVIFITEYHLAMSAMIQVFNFCFLAGKLSQIVVFQHEGLLGLHHIRAALPLVMTGALSLFLGQKIRRRIDAATYLQILQLILLVIALLLIAQYLLSLG